MKPLENVEDQKLDGKSIPLVTAGKWLPYFLSWGLMECYLEELITKKKQKDLLQRRQR